MTWFIQMIRVHCEENSKISDLRFFIAWTMFGAYFIMNSWKIVVQFGYASKVKIKVLPLS